VAVIDNASGSDGSALCRAADNPHVFQTIFPKGLQKLTPCPQVLQVSWFGTGKPSVPSRVPTDLTNAIMVNVSRKEDKATTP